MNREEIEFLVKLRDGAQMIPEATNDYLETFAPKDLKQAVSEETFTALKFEVQQGAKIGEYEVAYQPNNIAEKWSSAYNILRSSNATIKDRYHGKGYVYAYWLYGEGRIYRQKTKGKKP
jgi:hypothetical protein